MMPTIRDIIDQASRKVGMGHGSDLTGEEATAALDSLNNMFWAWKLDGIDIWGDDVANVDAPNAPDVITDNPAYVMADTFPMPNAFIEGTIHCLAARMAPEYEYPVGFDADDFLRKIQAHYAKSPAVTFDPILTYPSARRFWL